VRVAAGHRGGDHDGALRGGQRVVRGLRQQPRRARVDVEERVPVLDGVGEERAGAVDAGVAHETVEAAEARDRLADGARGRIGGRHVGVDRQRLGVELAQLFGDGVELCLRLRHVDDGNFPGASGRARVARQPQNRRPTDPARRARHQISHGLPPCRGV